ncbi:adhesin YadA precursor [mine drainage metagenome]|uniref:Adhesin YadA n=1 Tax=mine drainage metagenome TaxID=410659 RepID=A0A1J5SRT1_9ZZZZ
MKTNFRKTLLAAMLALVASTAWAATGGTGSGTGNVTTQDGSGNIASGINAKATGGVSLAIGDGAQATGTAPVGFGAYNTAVGASASIAGANNYDATALGAYSNSASGGSAVGFEASASGGGAGALAAGAFSTASGASAVAVGAGAQATGSNSVALGAGSTDGGQTNVVSVGSGTLQRRITNVAPGTVAYGSADAVDGGQLATTNAAVGVAQSTANSAANLARSAQGTANTALTIANNSAQYSSPGTLGLKANGGAGTLVQNVAAGQAATDAANVGQVQSAAAGAVTTANAYTSQQITTLQNLINSATASGLCKYNGAGGIVCGHNTTAATGAVAQGDGASAGYAGSLAIGQGATITAPTNPGDTNTTGAVAIGQGAQANADPAAAIGYQADAAGANSVALGYQATAYGNNSVALGAGSVANRANSVSVGSASQQRQITNVAPGTAPTDAVNLGQLEQATAGLLGQANTYAAQGIAMAAALDINPTYGANGYSLSAGVGSYGGQNAAGIAFSRRTAYHQYPVAWTVGVGFNGGSGAAVGKVGASIGW